MEIEKIAVIHTEFSEKFGIPRQSGLVNETKGQIVFEKKYRAPSALKGLEEYSHIWLIWGFSESKRQNFSSTDSPSDTWSPTVRPPRLGGEKRKGVFATRSPFRPNNLGLSCVLLEKVEWNTKEGAVLHVRGADILDGTPIYDIKPFLPYSENHPEAKGGFGAPFADYELKVTIPKEWERMIPQDCVAAVRGVLAQDPRPSYQNDPERIYGMKFAGMNIRFRVKEEELTVCEVQII